MKDGTYKIVQESLSVKQIVGTEVGGWQLFEESNLTFFKLHRKMDFGGNMEIIR